MLQAVSTADAQYLDGHDRRRVNITQACVVAGVCRRTIYNWIATGKVEYVRTAGGAIRIFVDTLLRDEHL